LADGMGGEPGDVVALEAEMRQAGGDVRFTSAERGGEHRRLEQTLEAGRAEAKHDLAERDGAWMHDLPRRRDTGDDPPGIAREDVETALVDRTGIDERGSHADGHGPGA